MSKKLLPEEELEKQYRDYKAQFEQWKEKNKGSEGTEGYIKYVKDFEKWENEVQQRKIAVRNKAEQERKVAERNAVQEEHHDEATAAARYAQEQQQYMAVHLRGIQDQERQQALRKNRTAPTNQNFNAVPPPDQQHLFQSSIPQQSQMHQFSISRQPDQDGPIPLMSISQRHPDQFDSMINSMEEAIKNGPHIRADPQPSGQQNALVSASVDENPRPMLWGPDGSDYLPADSMFLRWGLSALPPNLKTPYHPPHPDTPSTPCWYFIKKMEEKQLFYGHNVSMFGMPEVISENPPNMPKDVNPPMENGKHRNEEKNGQPTREFHDFSRPPPFDLSRPPPIQFNMPPPTF